LVNLDGLILMESLQGDLIGLVRWIGSAQLVVLVTGDWPFLTQICMSLVSYLVTGACTILLN